MAGMVGILMAYDSFSITVMCMIEDLGFCKKGEGGDFVSGGRLHFDDHRKPAVNTDGGGLSSNHPGARGIFLLIEAVRQLRGESTSQVANSKLAVAVGNGGDVVAIDAATDRPLWTVPFEGLPSDVFALEDLGPGRAGPVRGVVGAIVGDDHDRDPAAGRRAALQAAHAAGDPVPLVVGGDHHRQVPAGRGDLGAPLREQRGPGQEGELEGARRGERGERDPQESRHGRTLLRRSKKASGEGTGNTIASIVAGRP